MTALYVILGIVLFFALILSMRLKVYIRLDDGFRLRVGLGPVIFTIFPTQKRRKKINLANFSYKKHQKRLARERQKALQKSQKAQKKKQARDLAKKANETVQKEASGEEVKKFSLELIIEIIEFALSELPRLASNIVTNVRMIDITVGGHDAADCANKYGITAQLTSYLLAALDHSTSMKPLKPDAIAVKADFLSEKTVYRLDISFKVSLFSTVKVGIHTLMWMIQSKILK